MILEYIFLIKNINADKEQKDHSYWNVNELISAVLIMVHFHKISLIVESIKIQLISYDLNFDNTKDQTTIETSIKEKLLKNLEILNNELESQKSGQQDLDNEFDFLEINKQNHCESYFNKHINSFCNVYHDFDHHSEEYRSYLVK